MANDRKPFLDADHPMFAQAWVRWLVTLGPLAWAGFEFWMQEPFWALMFLAAGAYAGWKLILRK